MRFVVAGVIVPSIAWLFAPLADLVSPNDAAGQASSQAWLQLAERFGLWAVLCCILVGAVTYLSWKRECRMASRIDALESEKNKSDIAIATALVKNGTSLDQVNVSMQKMIELHGKHLDAVQELSIELKCRPCIKK